MFGEYAQIASYLQTSREGANQKDGFVQESMPDYLRPSYQPPQPWGSRKDKSGLSEDFIMVAEFSELEGPKPLMTIPKDGGANFDQNAFSVRILAVDHQSSSDGFTITEDAQVVLSDVETGVFAFVHHLVLYDNTARGFVRPYCIAYITTEHKKLMYFYEEISWQFKKVARFLKYGNKMLFVGDLERHLKDLEHTKGFLLNQVSKMRLRDSDVGNGNGQEIRKSAENELYRGLQTIRQSTSEIRDILTILKPLLSDRRLEARFRLLEDRAFQRASPSGGDKLSLQDNWFNDLSSLDDLDIRCGSLEEPRISPLTLFKPREYKPLLVETKKAKRFNAPLRGLHELCSWGAKEGLKKLRHIHEYFKRELMILELEKNESRLFRPGCASISHGQCVTGNFLSGVKMKQSLGILEDVDQGWAMSFSHQSGSVGSVDSLDSFKSAGSCSALSCHNNASPSSYHTYDSQSAHGFQSMPSSPPGNEISLLMENEYYSDTDEETTTDHGNPSLDSKISFYLSQAVETITNQETENSADNSTVHKNSSDSHGEAEVVKNTDIDIKDEKDCMNLQSNLSVVSLYSPLKQAEDENTGADNRAPNTLLNQQVRISNPAQVDATEQSQSLCQNSSLVVAAVEPATGNIETSPVNVCSETCEQNNNFSEAKVSDSSCTIPTTQPSLSENFLSSPPNSVQPLAVEQQQVALDGASSKMLESDICNETFDTLCVHQDSKLSSLLREEDGEKEKDDIDVKVIPSQPGIADNSSESVPSLTILTNSNSFQKETTKFSGLENPIPLPNVVESSSRNGSSSKLSNLLHPKYTRQFSGSTRVRQRKESQSGTCDDSASVRSDASSAFTELSVRELFPHLMEAGSGLSKDNVTLCGACDGCSGTTDPGEDFVDIPVTASAADTWKPRSGLYTLGDWINNICPGRPGCFLSEVLSTYQHLQHVIFSLLSGRPVLIAGSAKHEPEVVRLVTALTVFVPAARRKRHSVLDWTSKPLRITDLTKLRLVGICRPERRSLDSFIPSAIKKICTIVDVEKRIIVAPPYQVLLFRYLAEFRYSKKFPQNSGQFITALLSKKKALKTDIQLLSYIEWWLMDILAKAFIFFHSFCLSSSGSILYSHSPKDQRDTYCSTISSILTRLGIKDCDSEIIENLTEMVKLSRMEPHIWQGVDSGSIVYPLHLQTKICQTFRC